MSVSRINIVKTPRFEESRGVETYHRFLYHVPSKTFVIGGVGETHGHLYNEMQAVVKLKQGEVLVNGHVSIVKLKGEKFQLTSEEKAAEHIPAIIMALKRAGFKRASGRIYKFVEEEYASSHVKPSG